MRTNNQNQNDRDRAEADAGRNADMPGDAVVCHSVSIARRATGDNMVCDIMTRRFFVEIIPVSASVPVTETCDISRTGVDFVDPNHTLVENTSIITKSDGFPSLMQRLYMRQTMNARQQKLLVLYYQKTKNY